MKLTHLEVQSMTEQEKIYFEELIKVRTAGADMLEKAFMSGVKNSVVEKYSDQAHFIYELLQNADDVGATYSTFELYEDKLVFKHNGTHHFFVSDPKNEEEDTKNGRLGDINSITSIGNSNKDAKIGKFGVGFKAVFQYTNTPYIYDPEFRFYIDRFIVPVRIVDDYSDRLSDETVFVFPFNHSEKTKQEAYLDIEEKLKKLKFPILFLSNLKKISFKFGDIVGLYSKDIEKSFVDNDIIAENIKLTKKVGDDIFDSKLWMLSREIAISANNSKKYSVGFFLDENNKLVEIKEPAFCFFPTKETTELSFIVHAPFLLTESRESIKAGDEYNRKMIYLLAKLAADSFLLLKKLELIDDKIFNIIPYKESLFNDINDINKISFKPFFVLIKDKLKTEKLIPTKDGYTNCQNAYWSDVPNLVNLFSINQLRMLCKENKNAEWAFVSIGRSETRRTNRSLAQYIDEITQDWFDADKLIDMITTEFIKEQEINWLFEFYKYVGEHQKIVQKVKQKPIFLDDLGNAVSVFDEKGEEILFLPSAGIDGYKTVSKELLNNESTITLLKQIGIKEPTLKDEIYNKILPLYKNGHPNDCDTHFLKFFNYYQECPYNQLQSFIDMIKELPFVVGKSSDGNSGIDKIQNFYFPTEDLISFFSAKPSTRFIDFEKYLIMLGEKNKDKLNCFFKDLGVKTLPNIVETEISRQEAEKNHKGMWNNSKRPPKWKSKKVDGLQENLREIIEKENFELSVTVWAIFLKIVDTYAIKQNKNFAEILQGEYTFFSHGKEKYSYFDTEYTVSLKTNKWLFNKDHKICSPSEINIDDLAENYQSQNNSAKELIAFLGIKILEVNISDEVRRLQKLKSAGFTDKEIDDLIEKKLKKDNQIDETIHYDSEKTISSDVEKILNKICKKTIKLPTSDFSENDEVDEDDFTKPTIDYGKKIEQAEEKSRIEIEKIANLQKLQNIITNAEKYSYLWFKAILEMESIANGDDGNSREFSISFAKVELDAKTTRTLILKHPNRYIPQFIEDLADIPLTLHYGNQTKKIAVEVMNVQSYSVKAKLKSGAEIEDIDLSLVNEAKIEAQDPTFLLEELKKAFNALEYPDDFNLKENLTDKIDFIFGPPGTGKTTYLVRNVILPLMHEVKNVRVLVLTPTNKAADVITKRIMDCGGTKSYTEWLTRFGTSNDSLIEKSGVYKDKTFDIRTLSKNVLVTTIARFPYDFFMPESKRLYLSELKWDYIVIDEASMIPIANIIFPLYKKTPTKFIIAGDPFQIQPITCSEAWKDENIYTMVELDSFTTPKTVPHNYKVELLTTQYRSLPSIGNVYSEFAYGGVLTHDRSDVDMRKLNIDEYIHLSSLNLVKFPIKKYESIYKPKRLQGKTPYQIYSALFTFEFVKFVADKLAIKNEGKTFSIGIIAPYRAQADLIDKLLASYKCPQGIDVQVGTIHGFQGDECDIVFTVFNPPPKISDSKDMFLNKKNIINVSISRARDYLIIIMPDDDTQDIKNLSLINKVEAICKEKGSIEYSSHDIEKQMFNDRHYLENNSFATSHQIVNVYGKCEVKYEIRSEDTAVDIQIHTDEND